MDPGPFMPGRDKGRLHYTARQYTLSGGRNCQMRFTPLANGNVLVDAVVLRTNSQGNIQILARPSKEAQYGEKVTLPIGDGSVVVKPKRA